MGGACSKYGRVRKAYRVVTGKSEGRRQLRNLGIDGRIILK
jgi:hypothetical protein